MRRMLLQVGVGVNVDTSQLQSVASSNQSQTILLQSNVTNLMTGDLIRRLDDLLCNGMMTIMTSWQRALAARILFFVNTYNVTRRLHAVLGLLKIK